MIYLFIYLSNEHHFEKIKKSVQWSEESVVVQEKLKKSGLSVVNVPCDENTDENILESVTSLHQLFM